MKVKELLNLLHMVSADAQIKVSFSEDHSAILYTDEMQLAIIPLSGDRYCVHDSHYSLEDEICILEAEIQSLKTQQANLVSQPILVKKQK